ncbi:MAG TPA: DUF2795 domain-containing protein [Ktedonobacterales bacterium]
MSAHSLSLLDTSSSLRDTLTSFFNTLFQLPVTITALVLALVFAILGWLIAYFILRPKEVCSMVCSIHLLLTIATIILGLVGAIGLIDHYFPGQLITGTGIAMVVLTIPLLILVESFNYVVLSNQHARRLRDLRTPQDRRRRRGVVFLTPLAIGAVLLVVGIIISAAGVTLTQMTQVIILLLILWALVLAAEFIALARTRRRRHRLAATGAGATLDRDEVAALWVSGFSSYRVGRGETVFTSTQMSVEEREAAWGAFSERVFITEELLLEEEGELDLVEVEEAEVRSYAAAGAGGAALALHGGHRSLRHPAQHRVRNRWGGAIILLLIAIVATVFTSLAGVTAAATAGIALAFLAPAIFLVIYRIRRDNEVRFVTETAQKVSTTQFVPVAAQGGAAAAAAAPPAAPPSRRTTGTQPAAALHPARPVPVTPPIAEPLILPREEPEPPTLPSAEAAEPAGAAHVNPDIADDTVVIRSRGGAAHTNPDIAEDTLLIAHQPTSEAPEAPPAPRASRSIRITEFQHHLHGVEYPATRAELLEQARKNNAPPNMIVRLEELDPNHQFVNARDVMVGYANHRFLSGVSYPATSDQLLAHARATNVSNKLVAWLGGLSEPVTFASVTDVVHGYEAHHEEDEEDDEEEEKK